MILDKGGPTHQPKPFIDIRSVMRKFKAKASFVRLKRRAALWQGRIVPPILSNKCRGHIKAKKRATRKPGPCQL